MSNFVFNNTTLTTTKSDLFPVPVGANPLNYVAAADYNSVSQACIDLRTALKGWQGTVQTVSYTALTTDFAVYCNATGLTITLPAGAVGLSYLIKDVTGNASPNITIATTSAQTIDGASTKTVTSAYGFIGVVWDTAGGQWRVDLQSGGGASLGNWTFTGNNADLTGAGVMGYGKIGPTATGHSWNAAASTSGSPNVYLFTAPAHTTLAASTEASDFNVNLARTVQFSTGAIATQRAALYQAPTYGFVGASTITTAATLAVSGPPVAGTNATITYAIPIYANNNGIGATQGYGIVGENTTAGANNAQQYGPMFGSIGRAWDTGASASRVNGWLWGARPIQGNPSTTALDFYTNINNTLTQALYFSSSTPNLGAPGLVGPVVGGTGGLSLEASAQSIFLSSGNSGQPANYLYFSLGGNFVMRLGAGSYNNSLRIDTDNLVSLGDTTHRWAGLFNSGVVSGKHNLQSGATYTAVAGDFGVIMTSSSARTVTLPAANAFVAGQLIYVKDGNGNAGTNNVTVSRAGSDTIDGGSATSVVISTNNGKIWLESDGVSKWWQIV